MGLSGPRGDRGDAAVERGPVMPRGALLVFAVTAGLILILFLADHTGSAPRVAMSAWAVVAIGYGVAVYRPRHAYVWILLAVAVAVFQIADASDFATPERPLAPPGLPDWLALLGYPITAAGLVLMARHRTAGKDLAGLLDAAIVVAALIFPVWIYLVRPNLSRHDRSVAFHVAVAAPPLCDLLLLGLLIWLVGTAGSRVAAVWLLTLGLVACSAADAVQAAQRLDQVRGLPSHAALWIMLCGWIGFCLLWGAAALVPSMTAATRPVPAREPELGLGWLVLVFAAMLVTPGVVLERQLGGWHAGGRLGAPMAMVVVVLVMCRVALVLVDQRRARDAEKTLLASGNALLTAGSAEEVAATLTATATRLVGPARRHAVVVVVTDDGGFRVADSRTDDAPGGASPAGASSPADTAARGPGSGPGPGQDIWTLTGPAANLPDDDWYDTLAALGMAVEETSAATPGHEHLAGTRVPESALPPALASRLAGFPEAGVLPLGTEAWRDGLWSAGALAIAADEQTLTLLAGPMRILAWSARCAGTPTTTS
jgi:hypothetical protein